LFLSPMTSANMAAQVSVVILNYNTRELLERFLPSVLKTAYPNMRLVVVDNGSTDGSADWVEEHIPEAEVIRFTENHGFAGGYEHALQRIDSEYYVLLNSDVEVSPNWLQPLVEMAENNKAIAAIQPKVLDHSNPELFEYAGAAGGFIDALGYPFCRGRIFDQMEKDNGQYDQACEIFWATGAALFIRADAYHKAGGLDERFFAHMEEIDLCWRLHALGYELWAEPKSVVYHIGGGTLSQQNARKTFLNFRNALILLTKNLPKGRMLPTLVMKLFLDGLAGLRFVSLGEWANMWAIVRAHWAYFSKAGHWRKERKALPQMSNQALKAHPAFIHHSIVWQFFARGRKRFSELKPFR
jgi:GT2 family glycosyltransferase